MTTTHREPGTALKPASIAHQLGISSHGRWFTYDTLLDWAVKSYWTNRQGGITRRTAA